VPVVSNLWSCQEALHKASGTHLNAVAEL
jgi:hypothetical protein